MHGPRAAERHEREPARVDAALHGDDAKRTHHLLVRHPDDSLGGLQLVESQLRAQPGDGLPRRVQVQLHAAGQRRGGGEVAEQEVGVGHRRLGATAAVAGGPRVGARRPRSRPQRAARVAPADRAAPGAHGMHIDHGQLDHPAADLARVRSPHPSPLDDAHVAGGASHVEPHRVAFAREGGQQAGPDRPARRAGEDAPRPRARGLGGGRDPSGGHHDQRRGEPALLARRGEPAQIAPEEGGEVGVDDRGRATLVLAKLGKHLVRHGDVDARELVAQALGDRTLVGRLQVGEQKADRH